VNLSLAEIRSRRGALLERARSERAELGRLLASQRPWLSAVDTGLSTARFLWAQKKLLLIAGLSFAIVQPRRSIRWALRGWGLYRFVRKARRAFGA
jgi:hypothetical protein